ncbi:MAG TPA: cyclic beta 1-2 glucan synthetase, partial [Usitatibacter sp.]
PPMTTAFVSELSRRLQGHGPALALPLTWIEQRLSESHITVEELVQAGIQQQAANQVSVSNSIGSLRFLGAMDWRKFVETMSVVERKLLEDPAGSYGAMDFGTRDRYRHVVEQLAKESSLTEVEVARRAIQLSHQGAARIDADPREAHVGFYLVDAGRLRLEEAVDARRSIAAASTRLASRFPSLVYLGGIATLTGLISAPMIAAARADVVPGVVLAAVAILSLLASSHLAVALVNWFVTLLVTPRTLPRMDFSAGIPDEARTLVAVPALLASPGGIEDLAEALEVRFLANQDANLHFALLTDFMDASEETLPADAPLLRLARQKIGELNERYRAADATAQARRGDIFFLFHRSRAWNPQEMRWMGHERKRGKLSDLNALLRGDGATTRFSSIVGDMAALANVKYVITLDTDTELPRDVARQLVGAMAHPLNRARYDAARGRVTAGYGILQPRVVTSLPDSNRSRYARVFGGETGIDPYT